jgi:predicted GTPase
MMGDLPENSQNKGNPVKGFWQSTKANISKFLPTEQLGQKIIGWFSVDDTQVAEILAKVRAELPTTEVLLIGKPQAGKSSIVRGITGIAVAIIIRTSI